MPSTSIASFALRKFHSYTRIPYNSTKEKLNITLLFFFQAKSKNILADKEAENYYGT